MKIPTWSPSPHLACADTSLFQCLHCSSGPSSPRELQSDQETDTKGAAEAGGGEEISDLHLGKIGSLSEAITTAASLQAWGTEVAGIPSGLNRQFRLGSRGCLRFYKQLVEVEMYGFCKGAEVAGKEKAGGFLVALEVVLRRKL